jgi:hypothetical protein
MSVYIHTPLLWIFGVSLSINTQTQMNTSTLNVLSKATTQHCSAQMERDDAFRGEQSLSVR